jgi:pyruvate/2-oxoglutarate dehydrogenase complex dihydrolipoamide acyltransferase (E2) component
VTQEVVPVLVPHETVNDESVKLTAWLVASGEQVKTEQLLAQVETSKALLDIHSPTDGFVRYEYETGCEVAVGAAICYITAALDTPLPAGAFPALPTGTAKTPTRTAAPRIAAAHQPARPKVASWALGAFTPRFSRSAAELLHQHQLDPQQFTHLPLVKAEDVLSFLEQADGSVNFIPAEPPPSDMSKPVLAAGVPVRWEELSRRKLGEIRCLRSAQDNVLASSVTVPCPTRGLRSLLRDSGGAVSTPTPIIVFEAARLLREHPAFNAVCAQDRAGYYDEVNIGVAFDYDKGLMVPVVRHADHKELAEIAEELWGLMYKYMRQELTAEDLSGGTFVVSDLSAEGVSSFVPLINLGQSAILGIGTELFPAAGAVGSFNLILTFDHQLAEGRMAATFLNELVRRVQAHESSLTGRPGADRLDPSAPPSVI